MGIDYRLPESSTPQHFTTITTNKLLSSTNERLIGEGGISPSSLKLRFEPLPTQGNIHDTSSWDTTASGWLQAVQPRSILLSASYFNLRLPYTLSTKYIAKNLSCFSVNTADAILTATDTDCFVSVMILILYQYYCSGGRRQKHVKLVK
jgi:hypothetical protein